MADLDKIAGNVAEVAQRVADVLDAARGKAARVGAGSSAARLLVLPALNSRGFPPERRGALDAPIGSDDLRTSVDGDLYDHLLERAERRRRRRERTG